MKMKIILILLLICTGNPSKNNIFLNINLKNYLKQIKKQIISSTFFYLPSQRIDKNRIRKLKDIVYNLFYIKKNSSVLKTYENQFFSPSRQNDPTIKIINFRGNKLLSTKILKEKLEQCNIEVDQKLSEKKLYCFKKNLYQLYYFLGRYDAKISVRIKSLSNRYISLDLILDEGNQFKISQIRIFGNKHFRTEKLINLFSLRNIESSNFLKYGEDRLNLGLKELRSFYMNHGYVRFRIDHIWINLTENKSVLINIRINEGEQYRLNKIEFRGKIDDSYLQKLNGLIDDTKNQSIFRERKIGEIQKKIERFLCSLGYINPFIKTDYKIDDIKKIIQIFFDIDIGKQYLVKEIKFFGNSSIQNKVLRRKVPKMEDKPIDINLIRAGQLNLERTGFFEKVNCSIEILPKFQNKVNVIYQVKEVYLNLISMGIGMNKENGINFYGSMQKKNWFGLGNSVNLKAVKNDYSRLIHLSFFNPKYIRNKVELHSKVLYNRLFSKDSNLLLYDNITFNLNTFLGFPITKKDVFSMGLEITKNFLSNMKPEVHLWKYFKSMENQNIFLKKDAHYEIKDVSLNFSWNREDLDDKIFPKSGKKISISSKLSIFNSNSRYFKSILDIKNYFPIDLRKNWIFFFRTIIGFGNSKRHFPFYENFHSSEDHLIRGFQSDSIGPKSVLFQIGKDGSFHPQLDLDVQRSIGGNFIIMNFLELIIPNLIFFEKYQENVRTSFFIDSGTIREVGKQKISEFLGKKMPDYEKTSGLRVSTGFVLRWISPIGLINFSYAIPVKYFQQDKLEKFQFNIGRVW
ncbi:outer membrane protein assembly factor BamA [Candidatus Riesia pediculicola]|uniref:outer membrane protein assembly factor BamA n=1 Tax=Candidatus Riesia pediculicola TaxID=401619 RepID=UPI0009C27E71|nr:outer membrane protein assembly factor BamA [Candidatus Riesia pediculicola]ARC54276.1 hypothetical protein AOE57_01565 [Candidatus Riesia pediculicola]